MFNYYFFLLLELVTPSGDSPKYMQKKFQDSSSVMEGIILFNLHLSFIIFFIIVILSFIAVYFFNNKKLAFYFSYIGITYGLYEVLSKTSFNAVFCMYLYYFIVFVIYHSYFSFSKVYFIRAVVVIKGYAKLSEYFKIILWFFIILIPSLFIDNFIILFCFNQVLVFSITMGHTIIFFFFLLIWCWIFFLIICTKFGVCIPFLKRVQKYFTRRGTLHYLGNNVGSSLKKAGEKGVLLLAAPLGFVTGIVLNKDAETGNYAISRLQDFEIQNPNSSHLDRYKVFEESYIRHANSSTAGRLLYKANLMQPASPEAIIPDFTTGLREKLEELEKQSK
jgi:hypothetical protein